jgi:hypothetical protein
LVFARMALDRTRDAEAYETKNYSVEKKHQWRETG